MDFITAIRPSKVHILVILNLYRKLGAAIIRLFLPVAPARLP